MNHILLALTKLHIRLRDGRYVRTQTIKATNGVEQEVAIFSGDKPISLGQCTPFGAVIIHESVLNNDRLSNYVLIHEIAHKKQWWSIFGIPLFLLVILGFLILIRAFMFLVQSLISMNPSYLLGFVQYLIVSLLALVIPCAFSWILELNADFAAIKHIGLQAFLEIRDDLHKTRRLTLSLRILNRLTHPPVWIIVPVWHWRHKEE